MRILKYFILLLLIILIGAATYIAVLDGHFNHHSSITFKAPRNLVFQEVNQLKNWKNWFLLTSDQGKTQFAVAKDSREKKGFLTWHNAELETHGRISTTAITPYSTLEQQAFLKQKMGRIDYHINWHFSQSGDSTQVAVKVKGRLNFWAKLSSLFKNHELVLPELQAKIDHSLTQLKKQIKKEMSRYSIHVYGISRTESQQYVYTTFAAQNKPELLKKKRKAAIKSLKKTIEANQIQPTGAAFMIFNEINRQHHTAIVSVAFPIEGAQNDTTKILYHGSLLIGSIPYQRVVKSTLKGDYKNIPKLWEATEAYMRENNLTQDLEAHPYEVFKITAKDTENPANWITQLVVPIQEQKTQHEYPKDLGI